MRLTHLRGDIVALIVVALPLWYAVAADPHADQVEFFEARIRPIFADHCYQCHSQTAEKLKGGLRLDTPEALLKGGK